MNDILRNHPDWVAIRTGSDGSNEWMDAFVFVAPEDAAMAAELCKKGMEEYWTHLADEGMCYGDCIEEQLREAGIESEAIYCGYDFDNDRFTPEWENTVNALFGQKKVVYNAFYIGVYAVEKGE